MDRRKDRCCSNSDKYDSLSCSSDESSDSCESFSLSTSCTSSSSCSVTCDTTCDSSSSSSCSVTCDTTCDSSSSCSVTCDTTCDSSSSCSVTCDTTCDTTCDSLCDTSCYDPDRKPDPCPEDCNDNKCKKFNIYWFGSSLTDIGNGGSNLGLEPYTVRTLLCDVQFAYGPCARNSDNKVYPQFVGEDADFKVKAEYDICELPEERNHLISFSISGATQTENTTPLVPVGEYGYNYEVQRFIDLYVKSQCYAVPELDTFLYTDVGLTEFFQLLSTDEDPTVWLETNLVQPTIDNVARLYNEGKARNMIVQLIDVSTIQRLPAYQKLMNNECVDNFEQKLEAYDAAISHPETGLQARLNALSLLPQYPHFNLTVILSDSLYSSVLDEAETYGIITGQTILERGGGEWPTTQIFTNQAFFDDLHVSSHTNRVFANYVKTWFQQRLC